MENEVMETDDANNDNCGSNTEIEGIDQVENGLQEDTVKDSKTDEEDAFPANTPTFSKSPHKDNDNIDSKENIEPVQNEGTFSTSEHERLGQEIVEGAEDKKDKEINDDLEEGECSSEEEAPVPEPAPKTEKKVDEKRKDKRHRHRSRSRDRHKNKKRKKDKKVKEEISEEEQKVHFDTDNLETTAVLNLFLQKRAVLKKLKALEANMGIYDDYYSEEAETPAASEDSASEESSSSRSRSSSPSPAKNRKDKKRKREDRHTKRKRRRNEKQRVEGKDEVCGLFMQGKCQKVSKKKIHFSC